MKRPIIVCVFVTLTFAALYAQNTRAQSQSAYNIQQNEMRSQQHSSNDLQHSDHQTYINSLANLTKLRAKLAEAWQTLGMSPQAARAVANAYQPSPAQNVPHVSLRGKSDQEVAAMLQSALSSKNYMLANQTLIEYERLQAKLGTNTSPDGQQ